MEGSIPPAKRESTYFLVWRRGYEVFHRSLPEVEHRLLLGLLRGETFGELCDELAARSGDEAVAASEATAFIERWTLDELIMDGSL
jgi:hypothetical protein